MLCKATLIGRITTDLNVERSKNDVEYIRFGIACNTISQGVSKACFLNCVCFGVTAKNLKNYCSKGSLIFIDGSITQNDYTNKDGNKVRNYTIICNQIRFLNTGKRNSEQSKFGAAKNKSDFTVEKDVLNSAEPISPAGEFGATNKKKENSRSKKNLNFADSID